MAASSPAMAAESTKQAVSRTAGSGKPMRRSQRLTLRVAVQVLAERARGHAVNFRESTHVARVSAHGGLLELEGELAKGDTFTLRHLKLEQEIECRVVSIARAPQGGSGKKFVGFEFVGEHGNFWKISFPAHGARPIL